MPNKDEELFEKTFKGQADSTAQRVYYTLTAPMHKEPPEPIPPTWTRDDRSVAHRTAHVLAGLIDHLEGDGLLKEDALDELLLRAVM
jgi:hypothetical protein